MGARLGHSIVAILAVCIAASAGATEELIVRKGVGEKAEVAVPDFTEDGRIANSSLGKELSEALRFDLDNCGYYSVITNRGGVANAQRRDVERGKVLLPNWRGLDARLVFKADLRRTGGKLVITCYAYETARGKLVLSRKVKGAEADGRRLVHTLSNEIVKTLVGVTGFARTRIAFIKDNPGRGKDLYLVDYDGHNLRRVTRDGQVAISPDWAPNGRQIYYTSTHKGGPHVYRVDLDKSERVPTARFPGLNYAVAVSPNGRRLAAVPNRRFPSPVL